MSANNIHPFDHKIETISEFIERFQVQNTDAIAKVGDDGLKKAALLIKCLPVITVTELQRKLKPKKLSETSYDTIVQNLTLQYEVKKSIVGASVRFLNRKQLAGETIENFARQLNVLAADCSYESCCLNRLLRDTFVAGVRDTSIISTLLQECDKKSDITFEQVIEKAKLVEQLQLDAQTIKGESSGPVSTFKVKKRLQSTKLTNDYRCIRCTARGDHLQEDCWALKDKVKCRSCSKEGHIAKACKSKKIKCLQENNLEEEEEDSEAGHRQTDARGDVLIGHLGGHPTRAASNGKAAATGLVKVPATHSGASTKRGPPGRDSTLQDRTAKRGSTSDDVSFVCKDPNCLCEDFLC